MNITIERPGDNVPTLDIPVTTQSARSAPNIGIRFHPQAASTAHPAPPPPAASAPPTLAPTLKRAAPRPAQTMAAPPSARQAPRDVVNTFAEFANPVKQVANPSRYGGGDGDGDESMDGSYSSGGGGGGGGDGSSDGGGRGGTGEEYENIAGDYPAPLPGDGASDGGGEDDEGEPLEDPLRPSEGFRSLDEERTDIICKLSRLRKQGMSGLRSFGVHSDIREMRAELNRVRTELDMEASLKFQRKILMAMVSSMEFLNRRYDPFDLKLDGWSEQMMESLTDYDRVFERLFYKYRNKVSMPPEAELILMVGSSAFVFHLTNSMFKNNNLLQNPQFMQQMAQAMAQQMPQQQPQQPQQEQQEPQQEQRQEPKQQQQQQQQQQQGAGRRDIQAPSMDFSAFLGGGMPLPMPMMPPPAIAPPRPSGGPSGGPGRQAEMPAASRKRDAPIIDCDRLSDIISEDLASVPDDLSSLGGDEDGEEIVRVVTKKQRGKTGATTSKNVVLI